MFLSILLDGKELWLPAAVACSIIFLFALTVLSIWSRRKRAKLKEETSLVIGPYVEPPSEKAEIEEVVNDPTSAKTIQEEPVTTYCKNGCQGACACPVLDFQRTLTSSEPVLSFPVSSQPEVSTHLPPPEDIPPTDPLPEIPKESQSSLHRKSSHKNALQTLKEKFVKRDSLDAGSERRGSGSQGSKPRRSLFGKKTSISANELEGNESRNEIASEQLKSADWARRGSRRRKSSKQLNKRGSNKEINKDRRSKEVNKRGSNKEVDRIDKIRSENVGKQESKTGSLKLLRGMMGFKRTTSSHKQKIHAAK